MITHKTACLPEKIHTTTKLIALLSPQATICLSSNAAAIEIKTTTHKTKFLASLSYATYVNPPPAAFYFVEKQPRIGRQLRSVATLVRTRVCDMANNHQKLRWQERLFGRNLIKCDQLSNTDSDFQKHQIDVVDNVDYVGVYFSFANVYDDFVKRLKELYQRLNDGKKPRRVEVVQVVMWANNDVYNSDFENSHRDCLLGLPWFALPYSEIDLKVSASSLSTEP